MMQVGITYFPLILSSLTFHARVNTFKCTMQSCATNAMEPPIPRECKLQNCGANYIIHLF
jgi:hypothetical protein